MAESPTIRAAVIELRSFVEEQKASGMNDKDIWEKVRQEETFKLLVEQMNFIEKHFGVYEEIEIADMSTNIVMASTSSVFHRSSST